MLGRNDPCHCGSGKKYKKCCLAADEQRARKGRSAPVESQFEDLPDYKFSHDNDFIKQSSSDWRTNSADREDVSDEEIDIFGDEFEDHEDLDKDDERGSNPCPELPEVFDDKTKIAEKHPEMYQRGFEYFDQDLILNAIVTADSVPSYFDFFRKFPHHNPDKVFEIIHLLVWTNREKELLKFIEITSGERWYLPYEIYEE